MGTFESLAGLIVFSVLLVTFHAAYTQTDAVEYQSSGINNFSHIMDEPESGLFTVPFVGPIVEMINAFIALITTPIQMAMDLIEVLGIFPPMISTLFLLFFGLAIYRTIWGNR